MKRRFASSFRTIRPGSSSAVCSSTSTRASGVSPRPSVSCTSSQRVALPLSPSTRNGSSRCHSSRKRLGFCPMRHPPRCRTTSSCPGADSTRSIRRKACGARSGATSACSQCSTSAPTKPCPTSKTLLPRMSEWVPYLGLRARRRITLTCCSHRPKATTWRAPTNSSIVRSGHTVSSA